MLPIYEYECTFCGFKFEKRKPRKDSDEIECCPQCGAKCRKLITAGNFILKGPRWFKDGYSDKVETKKDGG
jgi:putative FmdB family regulatory protein